MMRSFTVVFGLSLTLLVPVAGRAQHTSSRSVSVLPLIAPPADSTLSTRLYEILVTVVQPTVARRGVQVTLDGQSLKRRDLINTLSHPILMDSFAKQAGAAFLIGGGLDRGSNGGYRAGLILYGVDDGTVIASESGSFNDEGEVRTGITEMARAISRPRVLTPTDTPIMYSLVIPGVGQLMLGKPVHALIFGGLVVRAITRKPDIPRPRWDALLPNWREDMQERQIMNIVAAWLLNVADTVILCRIKKHRVDTSFFLSIIGSEPSELNSRIVPVAAFRIRFSPR